MKIKHTENSSSKDEYQYYRKKPSKQQKNKNIMTMNTTMMKIIARVQG